MTMTMTATDKLILDVVDAANGDARTIEIACRRTRHDDDVAEIICAVLAVAVETRDTPVKIACIAAAQGSVWHVSRVRELAGSRYHEPLLADGMRIVGMDRVNFNNPDPDAF